MSKPDWAEAPEGATHYDCNADVFCTVGGWWHKNQYVPVENKDWGTDRYTPRPVESATTTWDGTGLPPVGMECEGVWLEVPNGGDRVVEVVIVKGYYKKQVWFCTTSGEDIAHLTKNVDFRPIRTQTQIDRAQLIKTLTQLRGETNNGVIADSILELGFRITN